ncbi:helix-turn-helix domain-containing protein [Brachybacterium paraconglomeratum]|uniref:helix-turn-helix domain-containing protein n=1 Tax=Brachybacterium paraconglomeratum TaxID=173362 RepID=UPI003FD64AB0
MRSRGGALSAVRPSLAEVVASNSPRLLGHAPHSHEVPELVYVVTGRAHLEVDEDSWPMTARDAVWLAPGVVHALRCEDGSMVFGALLSPGTRPQAMAQLLAPMPELDRLMVLILGAAPNGEEQIRPFRAALDTLLAPLAEDRFPVRSPRHPTAARVARSLVAHDLHDLSVQELARRECISARHLQRIFLEETGLSASRWRRRARLNVALRAIQGGSNITAAAHRAGYSSGASLQRALEREVGASALCEPGCVPGVLERPESGGDSEPSQG